MAYGKLGTDGVQIGEGCRNIKIEPVKKVSSCEMKKQEKCETKKQEKTLYNASDCDSIKKTGIMPGLLQREEQQHEKYPCDRKQLF